MYRRITLLGISLCFLSFMKLQAQTTPYYYYYKGVKQFLTLDTEHAFLSVKERQMPDSIQQRHSIRATAFRADSINKRQYHGEKRTARFYTELKFAENLSEQQYLQLLSDMKRQNKDAIISPYFKTKSGGKMGLSNYFYVKLKEIGDTNLLRATADRTGCIIIEQDYYMPLWFILNTTETSTLNAMEAANTFYETGLFQSAEPDLMVEYVICGVNDPYFGNQWGLKNTGQYGGIAGIDIKAEEAWTITKGAGAKLAIFDMGIELTHPDLAANMDTLSFDCDKGYSNPSLPYPQDTVYGWHGVACAGIAGAVQNNNTGISGVASECHLMAVTTSLNSFDDPNGVHVNNRQCKVAGFQWAWKNGADVISCSWSTGTIENGTDYLEEAIDSAVIHGRGGKGTIIVFAAGNYSESTVLYPACLPQVIAVGAINSCGERKRGWLDSVSCDTEVGWGSNYGTDLDIMAPGVLIPTTDMQGNEGYNPNLFLHTDKNGTLIDSTYECTDLDYTTCFSGTSSAAPHVAGVAALVISVNPCLTGQEVRDIIERTAQKVRTDLYRYDTVQGRLNGGWSPHMGYGLIDAHAAVLAAQNTLLRADLMIRDYENDNGTEPSRFPSNSYSATDWNSPDLWIRHKQDSGIIHQAPLPNDTNYCYVRIKNKGNAPSQENAVLKLYWAKSPYFWDSTWTGNSFNSNGALMGNFIDSVILPVIPCGEELIVPLPWHVPNPQDYCIPTNSDIYTFALLARIESERDPIKSETTHLIEYLEKNNNITMKNIRLYIGQNLLIRDNENDTGIEPTTGIISNSPKIVVSYNGFSPVAGRENTVRVTIKNISCQASTGNDTLRLYWTRTNGDSAMIWHGYNDTLKGIIGSQRIPKISAYKDTTIIFKWITPYYENTSDRYISILARIEGGGFKETSDLEWNVKNNRNIALKNIMLCKPNLMIRDNPADIGAIPNPYTGNLWESPDIWVTNGGGSEHQNILYNKQGEYKINVRLKNIGDGCYLPELFDSIYIYCSKTKSNTNFHDVNWKRIGAIAIPLENMMEGNGDECQVVIPWSQNNIPNPAIQVGEVPNKFYLLAEINTVREFPMISGNIETCIKGSDNLAGRSVYIGDSIDLWVKDTPDDLGYEPNEDSHLFYVSEDIWCRNRNDGRMNQRHQNPIENQLNYVYVRIRNRGNLPSAGNGGEKLELYWSKAGTHLPWAEAWNGRHYFNKLMRKGLVGDTIDIKNIPIVLPQGDTILEFPWIAPRTAEYEGWTTEPWHFCLLARIVAPNTDPMKNEKTGDIGFNIKNNNNIAMKNVSVIKPTSGVMNGTSIVIKGHGRPPCLKFVTEMAAKLLYKDAEVLIKLDSSLYNAWKTGGARYKGVTNLNNQTFKITDANAYLYNLFLEPEEFGILTVYVNFPTREVAEETEYKFHVVQMDCNDTTVIGGEEFHIIREPQRALYANAGTDVHADMGEIIILQAENVGEPAIYRWYDQNNDLICEGQQCDIVANTEQTYKLEVTALSDGYKDYDEVKVFINPCGRIASIFPNPTAGNLTINCILNNGLDARVQISDYMGLVYAEYRLKPAGGETVDVNTYNYPVGTYFIRLICGGVVVDTQTFVKQ